MQSNVLRYLIEYAATVLQSLPQMELLIDNLLRGIVHRIEQRHRDCAVEREHGRQLEHPLEGSRVAPPLRSRCDLLCDWKPQMHQPVCVD